MSSSANTATNQAERHVVADWLESLQDRERRHAASEDIGDRMYAAGIRDAMTAYALAAAPAAPQASQAPAVGGGWHPIETAPKDGAMLLLAGDNFGDPRRGQHVTVGSWRNERGWWEGLPDPVAEQMTANTQLQHLTHWMPIPSAPAFDVPVQHKDGE